MIIDHYIDLQDDTGQIGLTALRCTSCGEVIDAVILQNRCGPAPNLLFGTKQRNYAQRVTGDETWKSLEGRDHNERRGSGV